VENGSLVTNRVHIGRAAPPYGGKVPVHQAHDIPAHAAAFGRARRAGRRTAHPAGVESLVETAGSLRNGSVIYLLRRIDDPVATVGALTDIEPAQGAPQRAAMEARVDIAAGLAAQIVPLALFRALRPDAVTARGLAAHARSTKPGGSARKRTRVVLRMPLTT